MAQIVYIPQDVAEEGKQVLRDAGFEVRVGSAFDEATMIKEIQGCSAVLLRTAPFGAAVLEAGKDVKIVARHGAGYNNVDIAAADRLGIWVTNTPDATTNSVAEYTIGAILAATKKTFICAQAQKAGNYNYKNSHKGRDIAGLTLAVVGFGRIGRAVAKKAHFGLDMNIIAYDPYVKPESAPEYVKMVDWETAFSTADVVTIHMPATKDNGDCINKDTFALMKKDAFFINNARGELVKEQDLADAVKNGVIAGAYTDVYKVEPPAADHPYLNTEGITFAPHMASNTEECMKLMAIQAAQQIVKVLNGEKPDWAVNHPVF